MKDVTREELRAGLEKMFGKGECLERVFAISYMVAGYPEHIDEECFCDWMEVANPSIEEIVNYFEPI
jgi:hypothetical protein